MFWLMCSWRWGMGGAEAGLRAPQTRDHPQAHHPLPGQVPLGPALPSPGCRFLAPTNKEKLEGVPAQLPWGCPGEADPPGAWGGACGHEP